MAESPEQNVALFIDWDNLAISIAADLGGATPDVKRIVHKSQEYGRILIARAYAEWNTMSERLSVYRAGVEPVYAPTFRFEADPITQQPRGKSLADPVMVTDCIDTLHIMPQISTFVLVTGDKDLIPVVRLAQLRGRRVVVIGPDFVAAVLRDMADEFISYRGLIQGSVVEQVVSQPVARPREVAPPRRQPVRPLVTVKPVPPTTPSRPPAAPPVRPTTVEEREPDTEAEASDLQAVYAALVEILGQMATTGRIRVRATNLKDQLLVRLPGFSERKYGFSKFKDLLLAAERTGLLSVSAAGPVHWVSLPSAAPEAEPTDVSVLEPALEPTIVAETATVEDAEHAAKALERRLAVVRFIDELRARSRWLTYTYVLTNVIGFIGRLVPPVEAEAEARSILNYLVAEGALRIDKVPQEVDVGGIKHRVRMCHFVEEHPLAREARAISLESLPSELAAELSPAGASEMTASAGASGFPALDREPLEYRQTPAGEPSLELGSEAEATESLGEVSGNGHLPEESPAPGLVEEAVISAPGPETTEEGEAGEERPSRSRRGRRRPRSGGRKAAEAAGSPAPELEGAPDAGELALPSSTEVEAEPQQTPSEEGVAVRDVEAEIVREAEQPVPEVTEPVAPAPEPEPVSEQAASEPTRPTMEEVFRRAQQILEELAGQGKERVTGSSLKLRLGRAFEGFNERDYGFSKFRDFLQEAERGGYATLEMEGPVSWVRARRQSEPQPLAPEAPTEDSPKVEDASQPAVEASEVRAPETPEVAAVPEGAVEEEERS